MKHKKLSLLASLAVFALLLVGCESNLLSEPPAAVKVEYAKAPEVTGLTHQAATVGFHLTVRSFVTLDYGTTTGTYTKSTPLTSTANLEHSIALAGLAPSTQYFYRITAVLDNGRQFRLAESSLTTAVAPSPTGLALASVPVFLSTSSSVGITWTTNLPCTSQVEYGTAPGVYIASSIVTTTADTNQVASITGLSPSTTYYFRLRHYDSGGGLLSSEYSYSTTAASGVTPLALATAPVFSSLTTSSMVVTWTTNLASTSLVEYGTTSGTYTGSTVLEASASTNHSATITGLASGTTYFVRLRNHGASNILVTSEYSQATNTEVALALSGAPIFTPTTTGMGITWNTNLPAVSLVEYGTSTGVYSASTVLETTATSSHSVAITGLASGTTYYFRIRHTGATSSLVTSEYTQATPAATALSLGMAPVFSSVTTTGMVVTWTTNLPATSQLEYGTSTGVYSASSVLETSTGTNHTASLSGLQSGTTYYIRLRNVGASEVLLTSEYSQATTAATALALFGVPVFTPSTTGMTVNWNTNLACTSLVEYGTASGSYTNSTVVEATSATSHSATISGLSSGTTYYFRLRHFDSGGGLTSAEYTQSTTAVVPAVFGNPTVTATTTSITIAWTSDLSATSQVEYGTVSGTYPSNTTLTGSAATSHSHTLTGLTLGTTYYYRIKMTNSAGTSTTTEASRSTEPSQTVKNRGIWIIGGISGSTVGTTVAPVDLFDPVTSTWYSTVTSLPTPVSFAGYAALNGFLYIMGGFDGSGNALNALQIYNIAAGTWATGTVLPAVRANIQATVAAGRIYVIGGTTTNATAAWGGGTTYYEYTPTGTGTGGTWLTKTPAIAAVSDRFSYAHGGTVYGIGGRSAAAAYAAAAHEGLMVDGGVGGVGALTAATLVEVVMATPRAGVSGAGYFPGTSSGAVILIGGVSASTGTTGSFINQGTTAGTLSNLVQYLPEPLTVGAWLLPVGGVTTYPSAIAYASAVVSTVVSPARIYNFGGTTALTASAAGTTSSYYTSVPVLLSNPNWVIPSWSSTTMPNARWGHGAVTLNQ